MVRCTVLLTMCERIVRMGVGTRLLISKDFVHTTYLVTVGLWGQLLVQRSHLRCQILEVIANFVLLTRKNMDHRSEHRATELVNDSLKLLLIIQFIKL